MAQSLHAGAGEREIIALRASMEVESAWNPYRVCQVLLTDRNLMIGIEGTFGGIKETQVYPINQIVVVNGNAQVRVTSGSSVEIDTNQGRVALSMQSRGDARKLAEHLRSAATGKPVDLSADEVGGLAGMAGELGGALRDTVGSFAKGLGFGSEQAQMAAVECSGCGAPLTGKKGESVRCPYCDAIRQL